ncbi:MAG TPA: HDOD domain-containing protein [Spirochaetota bacterium]|nr:HDOD domain-containing protein [Spirochaetota bacterium]
MDSSKIFEVDQNLKYGKPIVFKDYKIPRENEDFYVMVLEKILKHIGKEKIADHLGYCLRELIGNAKKANTKRVFFIKQNLDITNSEHYAKGMKEFKEKVFPNLDFYLDLQEKHQLHVQIYFHIKDPYLNIIVSNNAPLLPQEKERISQKMARAKVFNSVDEAVQNVLDDTEGAGLGLVILILILRKIGVDDRNFAVAVEKDNTHLRIAMPLTLITEEETEIISDALIKEIDSIPQFPENILTLTNMLKDTEVDFLSISNVIRKDPGLTMDLLKMSNSAHYRRLNKIEKIDMAVGIVGVKGLKFLLQTVGAKKALEKKYSGGELEKLWGHSANIAQISSILCDKYKLNEVGDYAYIGGLLHDIGKIVLRGLHKDTIDKVTNLSAKKGISVNVMETLLEGSNHAKIGSKMATKWNLPENIVSIIKYHENPLAAPDEVKEATKIVYLAHIVDNKLNEETKKSIFDEDLILESFNITQEEELNSLIVYVKNKLGVAK